GHALPRRAQREAIPRLCGRPMRRFYRKTPRGRSQSEIRARILFSLHTSYLESVLPQESFQPFAKRFTRHGHGVIEDIELGLNAAHRLLRRIIGRDQANPYSVTANIHLEALARKPKADIPQRLAQSLETFQIVRRMRLLCLFLFVRRMRLSVRELRV